MKLTIPENIPLRWELFKGFGLPELLRSLVIMAVAASGAVAYALFSTSPMSMITSVLAVLFAAALCAGIFARQNNNLSMYDYIRLILRFNRSQHTYISTPEAMIYAYKQ